MFRARINSSLNKSKPIDIDLSGTYDTDPVRWIERYFYVPETGNAIVLEEYQRAVITEALRKQETQFVYSFILWSDLKKSAKSTIAAAVCLYLAWHSPWESVRVVANDLKQANSRTFFYIERAIRLNPILNAVCKRIRYHIELPNHTTIDAIPVDPKGEAGGGDLITCFTELWAMKNEASKQLWTETTLSPLKFGKSIRWAESYAGFEGESPILENAYESGVNGGALIDLGIPGLEVYVNQSARMLTLWNKQPRCEWQTREYYAQESAILTPQEFSRIHENKWSTAEDAFVPPQWWENCRVESLPPLREGQGVIIGLDGALRDDCFAILVVSRDAGFLDVRECNVWYPPVGGVIDFKTVEDELIRMLSQYNVSALMYDEMHVPYLIQRLQGKVLCKKFDQGRPRAVADKQLYDLIRERRIRHTGDAILTRHILDANRKPEDDAKMRIIKRNTRVKVDAAVSLSMAAAQAMQWNM